jgi:hypothetical protein
MHELGIARSIVAIVGEHACGRKVKRVTLPGIAALRVSARTGAGLDNWYAWLRREASAARDSDGHRS